MFHTFRLSPAWLFLLGWWVGEKLIELTCKSNKNNDYIKSLKKIECLESHYKCDRGKNKKVYFESKESNYINLGIGTCRGAKGIYKRNIKFLDEKKYKNYW